MSLKENELQDFLNDQIGDKKEVRILEAGCGSASYYHFGENAYFVGIDISQKQLERNKCLNESILGDIQSYEYEPSSFDVIISWAVLEHLKKPELALRLFIKALKKDGLLVLGLPNVFSVKGLFTKYTPHWVHVLYYQYILGRSMAGRDDMAPFKTYLRFKIAPNSLKRYAVSNGLKVVYFQTNDLSDADYWKKKRKAAIFAISVYKYLKKIIEILSIGKIGDSDFVIVLQK